MKRLLLFLMLALPAVCGAQTRYFPGTNIFPGLAGMSRIFTDAQGRLLGDNAPALGRQELVDTATAIRQSLAAGVANTIKRPELLDTAASLKNYINVGLAQKMENNVSQLRMNGMNSAKVQVNYIDRIVLDGGFFGNPGYSRFYGDHTYFTTAGSSQMFHYTHSSTTYPSGTYLRTDAMGNHRTYANGEIGFYPNSSLRISTGGSFVASAGTVSIAAPDGVTLTSGVGGGPSIIMGYTSASITAADVLFPALPVGFPKIGAAGKITSSPDLLFTAGQRLVLEDKNGSGQRYEIAISGGQLVINPISP